MTLWKDVELKNNLVKVSEELKVHITEAQLLLAQERFLARLSSVGRSDNYILKGGSLLLRLYAEKALARYTIDIDLLAKGVSISETEQTLQKAISKDLKDGFKFYSMTKSLMKRETPYGGERFEIKWKLFGKDNPQLLRVDVCSGDVVNEQEVTSSSLFFVKNETENLTFKVYPPEFIFAEKLETIARFKTGNTRVKDYIDLWILTQRGMSKKELNLAITSCFKQRGTALNIEELLSILNDDDYLEYLESSKSKKFKKLTLPHIESIASEIIKALQKCLR